MHQDGKRFSARRWIAAIKLRSMSNGIVALADQGLLSATNFVTMVLAARVLTAHAFGVFVLVYAVLLLVASFQTAGITRPLNVLAASLEGRPYRDYVTTSAVTQVAFAGASAVAILLIGGVVYLRDERFGSLLLLLCPALFASLLQEYVRQVMYTRTRVKAAFCNDVLAYGGQFAALLLLWHLHALTATAVLALIALTSALAAVVGIVMIRADLSGSFDVSVLKQNWRYARWLLAANVAYWLSSQAYPFLSAGLVSIESTAALRMTQNLVAPIQPALNAFQQMAMPQASQAFTAGGPRLMRRLLLVAGGATLIVIVCYFALIDVFASRILRMLYPDASEHSPGLVWLWTLSYFVMAVNQMVTLGLMASRRPQGLLIGRVVNVLLTFSIGIAAIFVWGVYGTLIGATITGAMSTGVVIFYFVRSENPKQEERLRP